MSMPAPEDDEVFRHYRGAAPAAADAAPPAVAADFGVRCGARFLDAIVGVLLGGSVGLVVGVIVALLEAGGALPRGSSLKLRGLDVTGFASSFVGSFLYQSIAESIGGASVGKWLCGLRVCGVDQSPDGVRLLALRPCSFGAAVRRSVAYLIDAQFCGAVAYVTMSESPTKQRLGDKWARTAVVVARSMATPARSPIPGVLLGLLAWGGCILFSLAIRLI